MSNQENECLSNLPFFSLSDEELVELYVEKTEWLLYSPFIEYEDPYEDYDLYDDDIDQQWRNIRPGIQWWEDPDPYM